MGHIGDEEVLVRAASEALDGTRVEAAGIFGLQELIYAQIAGGTLGVLAGDLLAPDAMGAGALGAAAGGRLAKEEAARRLGMTLQLLVAVTAEHVVVLNWESGDRAGREVVRMARSSTTTKVSGFGLSKIVTLHDDATDTTITLHATVAGFRPQSGPDKDVLRALAA